MVHTRFICMHCMSCDGVGGSHGAPTVIPSLLCSDSVGGWHQQIHICFERDYQVNFAFVL